MPWHQSMLGYQTYNDTEVTTCDSEDAYTLYALDYDFIEKGANFKHANCSGKVYMDNLIYLYTYI